MTRSCDRGLGGRTDRGSQSSVRRNFRRRRRSQAQSRLLTAGRRAAAQGLRRGGRAGHHPRSAHESCIRTAAHAGGDQCLSGHARGRPAARRAFGAFGARRSRYTRRTARASSRLDRQDRAHLGRAHRSAARGAFGSLDRVFAAAFSPDGDAHRHRLSRTGPRASGTRARARSSPCSRGTAIGSISAVFSPDGTRVLTASLGQNGAQSGMRARATQLAHAQGSRRRRL